MDSWIVEEGVGGGTMVIVSVTVCGDAVTVTVGAGSKIVETSVVVDWVLLEESEVSVNAPAMLDRRDRSESLTKTGLGAGAHELSAACAEGKLDEKLVGEARGDRSFVEVDKLVDPLVPKLELSETMVKTVWAWELVPVGVSETSSVVLLSAARGTAAASPKRASAARKTVAIKAISKAEKSSEKAKKAKGNGMQTHGDWAEQRQGGGREAFSLRCACGGPFRFSLRPIPSHPRCRM